MGVHERMVLLTGLGDVSLRKCRELRFIRGVADKVEGDRRTF